MNFQDLENAEVVDKELNGLAYNPDDYPTIDEFLQELRNTMHHEPVKIDLKELSVNGRVVADKMSTYLNKKANSSSALKKALENPASYYFYMNDAANFECKPARHFELGTFCHMAFLEPHLFDMVVVEPEFSLASNDGVEKGIKFWEKLIWDNYKYKGVAEKRINSAVHFCDENGHDMSKIAGKKEYLYALKAISGYTAIKAEHKLIIDIIKRNYFGYGGGIIPLLLRGAKPETSFYMTDADTGEKLKVRPDAFNIAENIGSNAVISFKTTSAPDLGKFIYDSAKYKYELSEGMYQEVVSHVTDREFNVTIMIVLQTVAPYLPAVLFWSPEDLANGKYKFHHALNLVRDAKASGLYPGFESLAESGHYGIIQMELPEWSKKLLAAVDIDY